MKKYLALVLALTMVFALAIPAMADGEEEVVFDEDLVAAAQEEGELVVYGSCEEPYLAAAAEHFQELFGIEVSYQRLSTGEVQAKIEEEDRR